MSLVGRAIYQFLCDNMSDRVNFVCDFGDTIDDDDDFSSFYIKVCSFDNVALGTVGGGGGSSTVWVQRFGDLSTRYSLCDPELLRDIVVAVRHFIR